MTAPLNYSVEQQVLGLAKETTRLQAMAAPSSWVSTDNNAPFDFGVKLLEDKAQRGIRAEWPSYPGIKTLTGKVNHPLRANSIVHFLQMLFGAPVITEDTVNVVTSGNDKIDFTVSSTPYTASLTPGSYATGASNSDAGSFCALLQTALNAVLTGFTVTYSTTTRLFTIMHASTAFVLNWKTGTNTANSAAPLLGATTADDSASGLSWSSPAQVSNRVFQHAFAPVMASTSLVLPVTYSFFWNSGQDVLVYNGVANKKLSLKIGNEGFVTHESELIGISEVGGGSIGTPSFADELEALSFEFASLSIGGAGYPDVKTLDIDIDMGTIGKRPLNNTQLISDVIQPSRPKITGSFDIYFETETERNKFLAVQTNYLTISILGNVLAGTTQDGLVITLPKIQYEAYPYSALDNLLAAKVKFKAVYDTVSSQIITATATNLTATI
jgi:hypothetical protein